MSLRSERFEPLFHSVSEPCLLTDLRGLIEDANAAAAALARLTVDKLVGKPLAVLVDQSDQRLFRRALARAGAGEAHSSVVLSFRPRGSPAVVPATADCIALEDGDGSPGQVLWVLHPLEPQSAADRADELLERFIHDHTAALRAAVVTSRREASLLRRVLDASPFGVLVVDATRRDVVLSNRAVERMLGGAFDRGALEGPDGRAIEEGEWPIDQALRTRQPVVDTRVSLRRPDGGISVLLARATPLLERGRMHAVLGLFVDLAARSAGERAESEFVANAAHDLRNPLTVISTAIELLQTGAKEDPGERDRFLDHIEREVARMMQLTRSLLTLAQADLSGEHPPWRPVDVEEVLRSVAVSRGPSSGVTLVVDAEPGLVAFTDPALLEQALSNLVDNAVKHADGGSVVLQGHQAEGGVLLRVSDTGPGIEGPTDDILERFSRRDDRAEGFGLGLAIVRKIAESLSAVLEIESEFGVGTSVSLLVPPRRGGR